MQNTALDNKIVTLRLKIRAIAKEIIAQKQIATTKKSLVT